MAAERRNEKDILIKNQHQIPLSLLRPPSTSSARPSSPPPPPPPPIRYRISKTMETFHTDTILQKNTNFLLSKYNNNTDTNNNNNNNSDDQQQQQQQQQQQCIGLSVNNSHLKNDGSSDDDNVVDDDDDGGGGGGGGGGVNGAGSDCGEDGIDSSANRNGTEYGYNNKIIYGDDDVNCNGIGYFINGFYCNILAAIDVFQNDGHNNNNNNNNNNSVDKLKLIKVVKMPIKTKRRKSVRTIFSEFSVILLYMVFCVSTISCLAARQEVSNCTFPQRWEGSWFLSGIPQPVYIQGSTLSFRGKCVASDGDKFLIVDEKGCHRCLVIYEKHKNILQYKENYCKGRETLQNLCEQIAGDALLFSLFKDNAEPVKCPLRGPFTFTYSQGHGECRNPVSNIESCTEDSRLLLSFQACPDVAKTESTVEELTCLATWKDGNSRYLVGLVSHHRAVSNEERYRCFVYEKILSLNGVPKDAEYKLAQSGDATCNGLDSAEVGSRMMTLRIAQATERCDFPAWFKGPKHWHSLMGNAGYVFHPSDGSMHITKPSGYMETRALCEQINKQTQTEMMAVVHYTTGCQSGFMCMMFYRRDTHVAEIQMGTAASRLEDACAPDHFDVNKLSYVTLLASNPESQECPVDGLYGLKGAIGPPFLSSRHKRNHNNKGHNRSHHHHDNGHKRHATYNYKNSEDIDQNEWNQRLRGGTSRRNRRTIYEEYAINYDNYNNDKDYNDDDADDDDDDNDGGAMDNGDNDNDDDDDGRDGYQNNIDRIINDKINKEEKNYKLWLRQKRNIRHRRNNNNNNNNNNENALALLDRVVSSNSTVVVTKAAVPQNIVKNNNGDGDGKPEPQRNRRDIPGCISNYNAQRHLLIGCRQPNVIEVRPQCNEEGEEVYSCHGSWTENTTVFIIAKHAGTQHGVCISYRPLDGNLVRLVIGDACYRGNLSQHHLSANLTIHGKCTDTNSSNKLIINHWILIFIISSIFLLSTELINR